jgi:hypothetical protein
MSPEERHAERIAELERSKAAERRRLDATFVALPESMRKRLTDMAIEELSAPLPDGPVKRALTPESPSVRAHIRMLVKRQEKARMERAS